MKTVDIVEMGNENEILAVYKRNSVTEWLQKTGQVTDYVNDGKLTIMKRFRSSFNSFYRGLLYIFYLQMRNFFIFTYHKCLYELL